MKIYTTVFYEPYGIYVLDATKVVPKSTEVARIISQNPAIRGLVVDGRDVSALSMIKRLKPLVKVPVYPRVWIDNIMYV